MPTRRALLTAFALVALPLWQASANPIPAASYSVTLNNGTPITAPGSYSQLGELGEIAAIPQPSVHAHVTGIGTSVVQTQYWFRVTGPVDNVQVPLQISGNIHISAGNAVFQKNFVWGVTAQLVALAYTKQLGDPDLEQHDNRFASVDCSALSVGDTPVSPPIPSCAAIVQSQDVVLNLSSLTGADNQIVLTAAANNQETFSANFDSLVDPIISFAPGFDSTGFEILLSDGVGNTVPEPSTALLLSFAPLLIWLRRP